jgi:hypothetical protein
MRQVMTQLEVGIPLLDLLLVSVSLLSVKATEQLRTILFAHGEVATQYAALTLLAFADEYDLNGVKPDPGKFLLFVRSFPDIVPLVEAVLNDYTDERQENRSA